jgi:hypothetical protein
VDNAGEMMRRAEEGGAEVLQPLTSKTDEHGTVWYGTVKSYGECVMTVIQRD